MLGSQTGTAGHPLIGRARRVARRAERGPILPRYVPRTPHHVAREVLAATRHASVGARVDDARGSRVPRGAAARDVRAPVARSGTVGVARTAAVAKPVVAGFARI